MFSYFLEYGRYLNLLGIVFVVGVAYLFSLRRSAVRLKPVVVGFGLLFFSAWFLLMTRFGDWITRGIAALVDHLYSAADAGIAFMFGSLGVAEGYWGFVFAIRVLPVIVFFGALMAVLFHLRIIQGLVWVFARVLGPVLGTSGAETLCAVGNGILGQTEAPLLIRNYLASLTQSELLLVMISGMGTLSGSIIAVYAHLGIPIQHLLAASVMAIPASIIISKIMLPETERAETAAGATVHMQSQSSNLLEAISLGTVDGLQLALNIGAILISFVALIGLLNTGLAWMSFELQRLISFMGGSWQLHSWSLEYISGLLFTPFSWLLGLTGNELTQGAELLGVRTAVNEMIAYTSMLKLDLSERTVALLTYALAGFANLSSIGIQIGGIGSLAPEKRGLLSSFGLRAVFGGVLVNILIACIAGLFI